MGKISALICVVEEELDILPRALSSLSDFVEDIVIIDMTDSGIPKGIKKTPNVRIYERPRAEYVEKVRNYGISKTTGDWVLILDPDEEVSLELIKKLEEIAKKPQADYYRIPRKNVIFGKWMKHSRWWPDMNIRFFKAGYVSWNELIHSVPLTKGKGADLPDKEEFAIVHHNYANVGQFITRMVRYTDVQSKSLTKDGYRFIWKDLVRKPLNEFLSRYFAGEGYKDGLHGLALAGLQAFSEFILYIKVWESEKFLEQGITPGEIKEEAKISMKETSWWVLDMSIKSKDFFLSIPERIIRRIIAPK